MALLPRCYFGHEYCRGHTYRPDLTGFPDRDPPRAGRCWCGQVGALWQVPLDSRWYCRKCIRAQLRVATYPDTIRFHDA